MSPSFVTEILQLEVFEGGSTVAIPCVRGSGTFEVFGLLNQSDEGLAGCKLLDDVRTLSFGAWLWLGEDGMTNARRLGSSRDGLVTHKKILDTVS